ncbi:MAG TPA: hypothetical protein VIN77_13455 [Aurantimonas sp.]
MLRHALQIDREICHGDAVGRNEATAHEPRPAAAGKKMGGTKPPEFWLEYQVMKNPMSCKCVSTGLVALLAKINHLPRGGRADIPPGTFTQAAKSLADATNRA